MATASTKVDITTAFNAGEFTPSLAGRIDYQDYKFSARYIQNFLPEVQGGLKKFYGTRKIAVITKPDDYIMVPFDTLDVPVVLVFHDGVVSVIDGDNYYDTSLTISIAGLKKLTWAQANAVIYFAHPTCAPFSIRYIGRDGDNKLILQLDEMSFSDVPYFPVGWSGNFNGVITTDGESGTIHVTAGTTLGLRLKMPSRLVGSSGAFNVLSSSPNDVLFEGVTPPGAPHCTVTLGTTKVELIRKRNGVESVVMSVDTGVANRIYGRQVK